MGYQPPGLLITSLKVEGKRLNLGGVSMAEAAEALQRFAEVDITTHSMLAPRYLRRYGREDRVCSYCHATRREVLRVDRCEGCGASDWKEEEL